MGYRSPQPFPTFSATCFAASTTATAALASQAPNWGRTGMKLGADFGSMGFCNHKLRWKVKNLEIWCFYAICVNLCNPCTCSPQFCWEQFPHSARQRVLVKFPRLLVMAAANPLLRVSLHVQLSSIPTTKNRSNKKTWQMRLPSTGFHLVAIWLPSGNPTWPWNIAIMWRLTQ